ncbi:MAG TPA: hypothetical protein VMZ22_11065 [Acidimicrobiales bacterium]|nr:hypothetical protein [Acidimicrobiales bacterium]
MQPVGQIEILRGGARGVEFADVVLDREHRHVPESSRASRFELVVLDDEALTRDVVDERCVVGRRAAGPAVQQQRR